MLSYLISPISPKTQVIMIFVFRNYHRYWTCFVRHRFQWILFNVSNYSELVNFHSSQIERKARAFSNFLNDCLESFVRFTITHKCCYIPGLSEALSIIMCIKRRNDFLSTIIQRWCVTRFDPELPGVSHPFVDFRRVIEECARSFTSSSIILTNILWKYGMQQLSKMFRIVCRLMVREFGW